MFFTLKLSSFIYTLTIFFIKCQKLSSLLIYPFITFGTFFNLKVSEEDKMAKKSIPEKPQKYAINRLLLSDTTKDSDEDTIIPPNESRV